MADIYQFIRSYRDHLSTFKQTSFDDDNHQFLCSDESQSVIAFDDIIKEKYPDPNVRPKSFDALYIHENYLFCVEFKNQKKPDKQEIAGKLVDGKRELETFLAELNISRDRYQFVFCLVYNKHIPHEERYKPGLYRSIRFEYLNQYIQKGIVDAIFTENVDFFTRQFKKQLRKELAC